MIATITWICLAIQLGLIISASFRLINARKNGLKWYADQLEKFRKERDKDLEDFKEGYFQRHNLLSKENGKLIEENEKLRGKLKNLGFTDITLDK